MLKPGLVSLISPCYNGERYVEYFIKSLLAQTYKDIQMIFVDDGSTDGTAVIIEKYLSILRKEFAEVIFLKKENGGAASAVNDALKYVRGEYLAWADCDDELLPDNIYKKVECLKTDIDKGLVMCGVEMINERTGKVFSIPNMPLIEKNKNIFDKMIYDEILCYPGVFMIRTKLLFDRLGVERSISYCREVGQNWQLLLPVAYDNDCGYIQENLYRYFIRSDSHSHIQSYERKIQRTYEQERILKEILDFLEEDKKRVWFNNIEIRYIKLRMDLAFEQIDKSVFDKNYALLSRKLNEIPKEYKRKAQIINIKQMVTIYKFLERIKRKLKL